MRGVFAACLFVISTIGAYTPPWLHEEITSRFWNRTLTELQRFDAACSPTFTAQVWQKTKSDFVHRERVIVFDVRHGDWVGLADSMSRVSALLRVGRWLGRTPYIWANGCADKSGPSRLVTTARANGSECFFDHGEWFQTLGAIGWRWSARQRFVMQHKLGSEKAFTYQCKNLVGEECKHTHLLDENGTVVYEDFGESRVLNHLSEMKAPWVRVELTAIDDFRKLSEKLERHDQCDLFANTRPKPALWRAMGPHLKRINQWDGFVALAVRTGFADHVGLFPELVIQDTQPLGTLETLFAPCPEGVEPVSRFSKPGTPPCVHYQTHAISAVFLPDEEAARACGDADDAWFEQPTTPFKAYVYCAAAAARKTAGSNAWGVMILSDSPAVKRAVTALLGSEHTLSVPSPRGHVQYTSDRGVGEAAAVDFYLAGLTDCVVRVSASLFVDKSSERNFLERRCPGPILDYGWPQWFEAGHERAMGRNKVSLSVMRTLN